MKTNTQSHWILREIAEEKAVRSSINLWPKIETRLKPKPEDHPRAVPRTLKGRLVFVVALALLMLGSVAFIDSARAFVMTITQRMGIAFVDASHANPSSQSMSGEAVITANATMPPSPSLAEIKEQVPYHFLVPTWLPDGLDYVQRGVRRYDPQGQPGSGVQITFTYARTADFLPSSGILYFRANDGEISAPALLAEGRQQPVTVNGQAGYYVHGGWQNDGTGDPNTRLGDLLWDDQSDDAYLTWAQSGVTYLLEAHYLRVELNQLIQIAESIEEP